ncbi:MAG: heme/hemin ABC transporter substrate-binding protein [Mangrovicoccus sp.]
MRKLLAGFALTLSLVVPGIVSAEERYPEAKAIVSVGGPVTEIVYALGQGHRLVGRDTTSQHPAEALSLPDLGYMRQLSAEGVLSIGPDLILARDSSGPPETMEQLRAARIPIVLVHDGFSADAVLASIRIVGQALGAETEAEALALRQAKALAELREETQQITEKKRVLFVLSTDGGRLNAAGAGTGADGLITLAGGVNVMAEAFESYKLVNDEAVITAAPDVILMMEGRGNHSGRAEEILALPAIAPTPAAAARAFVTVPPAALGFGPRTADMARELFTVLYGPVTAQHEQ